MHRLVNSLAGGTLLILFFVAGNQVEAQIWKDMGRKVEKKIEEQASRRLERKIDKAIDKGFDKTEEAIDASVKGGEEKTDKQESTNSAPSESATPAKTADAPDVSGILAGLTGPTKVLDSYEFTYGIHYVTTTTKKNGKTEKGPETAMWLSDGGYTGAGIANQDHFVVMDLANKTMVMFQPKAKTYMAMSSDLGGAMAAMGESSAEPASEVKFEKLNKTEKIQGYNCELYRVESEDGVATLWITPELKVDYSGLIKSMGNFSKSAKSPIPASYQKFINGALLKLERVETGKGEETFVMEATKVDKAGKVITTSEFKSRGR
jgi:hypothetical protein